MKINIHGEPPHEYTQGLSLDNFLKGLEESGCCWKFHKNIQIKDAYIWMSIYSPESDEVKELRIRVDE